MSDLRSKASIIGERRQVALAYLGQLVVDQAGRDRDPTPDSDLDSAQPVVVRVVTTLGMLRRAGIGLAYKERP